MSKAALWPAAVVAALAVVAAPADGARGTALTGSVDVTCSIDPCRGAGWTCDGPVALDSVTVNVDTPKDPDGRPINGVALNAGCTGTIGVLVVRTVSSDGLRISDGARDVAVLAGSVTCSGRDGTVHQDGIQVGGGTRVSLYGLVVSCPTANNAQLFVDGKRPKPMDVVCFGCEFRPDPTHIHSVTIGNSLRSGAVDSLVCPGSSPSWVFHDTHATQPVNLRNVFPPSC